MKKTNEPTRKKVTDSTSEVELLEQPNQSLSQFWNNLKEELKTIKNKEKGNKCNN